MKKYALPAVLLAAGFSLSTIGFQKQEIKAAEESGTEVAYRSSGCADCQIQSNRFYLRFREKRICWK